MKKPIFLFYHTKHYAPEAQRLITSLEKFHLDYHRQFISSRGTWLDNVNYKPCFLKQFMLYYDSRPIVYLDADAEVIEHPALFFNLDVPLALHQVDWAVHRHSVGKEILSGTLFLNNSDESHYFIDNWMKQCSANKQRFDQLNLASILNLSTPNWYQLPASYCCIFDLMKNVEKPVILHHQASRYLKDLINAESTQPKNE